MALFLYLLLTVFLNPDQDVNIEKLIQDQQYEAALFAIAELDSAQRLKYIDKKGFCAFQLGLLNEAKTAYYQLLVRDSMHLQANLYLSLIYEAELNLAKAIYHSNRLIQIDSSNAYYFKKVGKLYSKTGLNREASQYFETSIKLNPKDISTRLELVDIANTQKNWQLADSLSNIVLSQDSSNIRGLLGKSRAQYGLKDYAQVAEHMERVQGRLDVSPYYKKILGYSYLQIDSLDKAIHTLESLLYKEQAEHTYYYLAMAYGKKEAWEESTHYYKQAIKAGISGNIEHYYASLAVLHKEQEDWPAALKAYDQAYYYDKDPIHLLRKAQLAEWYYKDKSIALRLYQKGIATNQLPEGQVNYANERIHALREEIHLTKKQ